MRFLYLTDTHIRGTAPRNRLDDFYETLKAKLTEVVKISHDQDVDYILHGGDWFDRPDISPSVVRDFSYIFREFEKPIYTVAGNHDVYGQNPDTVGRSMLGILEALNLIKLIGSGEEIILSEPGLTVQLTGSSYRYDMDDPGLKERYRVKKRKDANYAVHLVHGMLLEKPFIQGVRFTLLDEIADTGADITLSGHYHSGFGVKQRNGRYFINPGSLVRMAATKAEAERKPEVVVIHLADRIKIEEILLKSALPADEIMNLQHPAGEEEREMKLRMFFQRVESAEQNARVDMQEIIRRIASDHGLEKAVKEEAIRRISLAGESIHGEDEE